MGEKLSSGSDAAEQLYKQYGSIIYPLYFIHTCLPGETRTLIKEQAGDWLTSPKSAAQSGQAAVLRQAHSLCMQYYTRKPRKKIKAERLKKLRLPFLITDELIAVLHLPIDVKSPLVLCFGLGLSPQEAGEILKRSASRVSKRLEQAKAKLGMTEAEIKAILEAVRLPETDLNDIYERFLVESSEKGYAGKRRLGRFKRAMDNVIPYVSVVLLLILLFAFLAVHFGWFGESYNEDVTASSISEVSAGLSSE